MSSATVPVRVAHGTETSALQPSFLGMVRGEFLKVARQWSTWIMLALLVGVLCLPFLISLTGTGFKEALQQDPLDAMYRTMGRNLLVLRVFVGPVLVVLTARLIGMEYSSGTIRVLLSRGVGRLQLLGAKLLVLSVIGLGILIGGLLVELALTVANVGIIAGNLDALKALNSGFWDDTRMYVLTIAISMAVTILMAAAVTILGRSLAVGLSVGLTFFAADNIGVIFFYLAFRLTNSDFWNLATGNLLGPNLNAMPRALLSHQAGAAKFGSLQLPLVPVTGGHTLLVTAIWTAAFLATAILLTWKRDIKE